MFSRDSKYMKALGLVLYLGVSLWGVVFLRGWGFLLSGFLFGFVGFVVVVLFWVFLCCV